MSIVLKKGEIGIIIGTVIFFLIVITRIIYLTYKHRDKPVNKDKNEVYKPLEASETKANKDVKFEVRRTRRTMPKQREKHNNEHINEI